MFKLTVGTRQAFLSCQAFLSMPFFVSQQRKVGKLLLQSSSKLLRLFFNFRQSSSKLLRLFFNFRLYYWMTNEAFTTLKQHWLGGGGQFGCCYWLFPEIKKKFSTVLTMIVDFTWMLNQIQCNWTLEPFYLNNQT